MTAPKWEAFDWQRGRGWRRVSISGSRYLNTTNYRGSRFVSANIFLGWVHLFADVHWMKWPEFEHAERHVEISLDFPWRWGRKRGPDGRPVPDGTRLPGWKVIRVKTSWKVEG